MFTHQEASNGERAQAVFVDGGPGRGGPFAAADGGPRRRKDKDKKEGSEDDVSAPEDLMREHGVLNRILLIYEEGLRRLRAKEDVAPDVFHKPATLVRKFVEDYHEKLEENFIFPEFEKRKKLVDLVKVLRKQHQAGRDVTDVVLRDAGGDRFRKEDGRKELVDAVRGVHPHVPAARGPRGHGAVPGPAQDRCRPSRLKELGEQFEKEEDRLFGDEGFEKTVDQVAAIEKQLGIYDLAQFTPKTPDK